MKLYIIRHGETDWNVIRRLQGRTDIPLNENGRALAKKTARGLSDVNIDRVITSPLCRAKETAAIITGSRTIPVIEDNGIQEISFGILEGLAITNEMRNTPGSNYYNFFHDTEHYVPPDHGESLDSLCERTADFLDWLKNRTEWSNDTILVSTHGAASRALLTAVCHTPRRDFWLDGVPKNCAVSIVELIDGAWHLSEKDRIFY